MRNANNIRCLYGYWEANYAENVVLLSNVLHRIASLQGYLNKACCSEKEDSIEDVEIVKIKE